MCVCVRVWREEATDMFMLRWAAEQLSSRAPFWDLGTVKWEVPQQTGERECKAGSWVKVWSTHIMLCSSGMKLMGFPDPLAATEVLLAAMGLAALLLICYTHTHTKRRAHLTVCSIKAWGNYKPTSQRKRFLTIRQERKKHATWDGTGIGTKDALRSGVRYLLLRIRVL